jgi:hypothetical protein
MCSSVALTMLVVVGLAVLWRRGWVAALLHTVPLVAIYVAWYFGYARQTNRRLVDKRASLGELVPFVRRALRTTFDGIGHSHGVGLLLVLIFVVGIVVAWLNVGDRLRSRSGAAVALAIGAVLFIASVGLLRASAQLSGGPREHLYISRYVNISAALLLPALAVAVTALARRWRFVTPIVVVVLLLGLPGNYHALSAGTRFHKNYRHRFLVLAHSPLLPDLPDKMIVPPAGYGFMTVGWMADGVAAGRIPSPGRVTDADALSAALVLQLSPYMLSGKRRVCTAITDRTFTLDKGDQLAVASGTVDLVAVDDNGTRSASVHVVARRKFQVYGGPLTLQVKRTSGRRPVVLRRCSRLPPKSAADGTDQPADSASSRPSNVPAPSTSAPASRTRPARPRSDVTTTSVAGS